MNDLEDFIRQVKADDNLQKAYRNYWLRRDIDVNTIQNSDYLRPYDNTIKGVPRVMLKVPTAGGKTFIACNSIKVILDNMPEEKLKVVAWFVPSDVILKQTYDNLNSPDHPYRQKINQLFGNRVVVVDKETALTGQGIQPNQLRDQLTIFVLSVQSFASKTKEGRKVFKENSNLSAYAEYFKNQNLIDGADDTSLIQAISALNPVVIIDESHNFGSPLRIELFQQINPRFILDLTATPRKNSNIISFVDSKRLKDDNMVKLPVILYNRSTTDEVINDAITLRNRLERFAIEAGKNGGRYIRPIVLLQAQPNKDEESITFQKIKAELLKKEGVREEHIKIKTATINELKGIDLRSKDCEVRYIITVNALKEGWDCPFAYILASLANRSSKIDVEQILGRVLRKPYTMEHKSPFLNYSYVFTSSSNFQETVNIIIDSLYKSGFSQKDYRLANPEPENTVTTSDQDGQLPLPLPFDDNNQQQEPSGNDNQADNDSNQPDNQKHESDGGNENQTEPQENQQDSQNDTQSETTDNNTNHVEGDSSTDGSDEMLGQAQQAGDDYDTQNQNQGGTPSDIKPHVKEYTIISKYQQYVDNIKLPKFYKGVQKNIFNTEGNDILLSKSILTEGFALDKCDKNINFERVELDATQIDLAQREDNEYVPKSLALTDAELKMFNDVITSLKDKDLVAKRNQISGIVARKMRFDEVHEPHITNYVKSVFQGLDEVELMQRFKDVNNTISKFTEKIRYEIAQFQKQRFFELVKTNQIKSANTWTFAKKITFPKKSNGPQKNLYTDEADMNDFELRVINAVAKQPNIVFWHRNLEKGKGFCINGFINHYPDFIIYTEKGNIILLETKGDDRDNSDSKNKIELGNKWQELAGSQYKYFMVFDKQHLEGAYTLDKFIEMIKVL